MKFNLAGLACSLALMAVSAEAQTAPTYPPPQDADLHYVIYLSRHGVRSPTGRNPQYNLYSSGVWPEWPVQPGYLTPHGFHLMELFGAYDRTLLSDEHLVQPSGCADAAHVTVYADSDQRTRETGKALSKGFMPGCNLTVQSVPEGTNDPLFHSLNINSTRTEGALATAAVAGRIGNDPSSLTLAYKPQLEALDRLLACGKGQENGSTHTRLMDIPAKLSQGSGDHLVDLKGPLNTASTLAENLLLEYTEGMNKPDVGWGCAGLGEISAAIALHTAATDYTQRTPYIARVQASNLLDRIRLSLQQAAQDEPVAGALGKSADRVLFLVGHDTNQENVAGLLNLDWIIDGRRDDTPPGGALVFELWRDHSTGGYFVRTWFTAQSLDQMRSAQPLTRTQPPVRVPVFVPGCSGETMSCDLFTFLKLLQR